MSSAFPRLRELQLNATMTTWRELRMITNYLPGLFLVEMGYNRLDHLSLQDPVTQGLPENTTIQVINLDVNKLASWSATCKGLEPYPSYVVFSPPSPVG